MKTTMKQGAIHLTGASLLFIVVGYFINIILGRFLGPVQYGIYGVLVSLISVANILQTAGLTQAMAKYIAENEEISDEILRSSLILQTVISLGLTIIFFIIAPYIALILRDDSLTNYIRLAALSFPIYGFYALFVDYYNGRHFFKKQAFLTSMYSLSKAVSVIILGYLFSLKGVLVGYIIAPLISLFLGFYYPKRILFRFPYKKLIIFSLPIIGYIIFSTLLQSIDLYFVKAMLSPESAGYYTASQNISRILYFATLAVSSIMLPTISQNVQRKLLNKIQEAITTSLRIVLLILAGGIALISATSHELLIMIYSNLYSAADESLSILAISFGFFTFFTLFATILTGAGKPKVPFVLSLFGLIMNMLLCFILIPYYQLTGAAVASLVSNVIVMSIAAGAVYRQFSALLSIRHVLTISSGGCLAFLCARVLTENNFFLPIIYVLTFSMYVLFLIITNELTREDVKQLRSI